MSNQQLASRVGVPTLEVIPIDASGNVLDPTSQTPTGAVLKAASSGNVTNATAAAALAAVAARFNYCAGVSIDIGGATGASIILVTIAGAAGGTLTIPIAVPAGVTLGVNHSRTFNPPLKSSAVNTAITVSAPAAGAGNTNAATSIWGYDAAT